jgi:nuclear transport factor 2 (NTF2) superfamily protein
MTKPHRTRSARPFLPLSALALAVLAAAGCQSPRHSDAILLKKDPGSSVLYRAPGENDIPYATNVVHVPRDARFTLNFEALNPGWLHADSVRRSAGAYPFSRDNTLAGRDLWLLVHIRSLPPADALQIGSKHATRASVVKSNLRSFGIIPLTVDEATPFALEANTDYEIDIRLYEVNDSFQQAAFVSRPGLTGVARTAWATTTDTFKSLVGGSVARAPAHDLPIERRLIDAGGTLRFDARFAIYRGDDTLAPRHAEDDSRGGVLVHRYQLIDPDNRRASDRNTGTPYADSSGYLERLDSLENTETPGRQDAFLRFRIESMWSPVVQALAAVASAPAATDNVSEEQALASESLATTARETFLRFSEEEKQARLAATESLRKSDGTPSAGIEETARGLSRKTREVTAARDAMEAAQARAKAARQAVEAAASRAAETANAEQTVALASSALDEARRSTAAAVRSLDEARDALRRTREAAEAARLRKEEWMQTESRAQLRLDSARADLAGLRRKADKNPGDPELLRRVTAAEQAVADVTAAMQTANSEWKLAQKDQEAKLNEIEDRIGTLSERRLALAEAEAERQRVLMAKDRADAILQGTDATNPRPAILRARSL